MKTVGLITRASLMVMSVVVLLSGCYYGPFGTVVTQEQKAKIVRGKTTKVDLLRELGEPDQIINLGDGKEQFSYISEKVLYRDILVPTSQNTEFWIILKNGVVMDFGERPTTKSPKYIK